MDGQVLLARVTRNGFVESVHAGHAVLVDPDGAVISAWGRPQDPVLPRSSNKPLQAVGMVEAGLGLSGPQLAIAAASHSGESFHLATVRAILADAGLSEDDLANTPALPYTQAAQVEWIRAGGGPTSLTQNCSGKHAAMLRTALAIGAPTAGYIQPDHPVQRAAAAGIEAMSGERIVATGVDGCGAAERCGPGPQAGVVDRRGGGGREPGPRANAPRLRRRCRVCGRNGARAVGQAACAALSALSPLGRCEVNEGPRYPRQE